MAGTEAPAAIGLSERRIPPGAAGLLAPLSAEAGYINGTVLPVDGGLVMGH